jgi:hypothetical protein
MPREAISSALMRAAIVLIHLTVWSSVGAWAQTPPSDEVAKCRSIAETNAQFACFRRLNEKMKRAKEVTPAAVAPANQAPSTSQAAPDAPAAANVQTSGTAAAESIPACASLSNPQKRLSCYDSKWPPPPAPPVPPLLMNN